MPEGSISRTTQPTKPGGKLGCLIAIAVAQAFVIFLLLIVMMGIALVKSGHHRPSGHAGLDEQPYMDEIWSSGSGETKVVVIPVRGFIGFDSDDALFSSGASDTAVLLNSIKRATTDDKVQAIILDVDSGGGGITASDIIYKALTDFKASRSGRKIVVLMGDVAASGAYYISLPADRIIAHPTSITGSIGVLMQTINIKGMGEKIGLKGVTIKSGPNKDILNPFEDVSEAHRQILQDVVNELQERFVTLVADNRNLPIEKVRVIADGKIYSAEKAKSLGLIDAMGYWDDAVQATKALLGVNDLKIYRYEREFSLSMLFRASTPVDPVSHVLPHQTRSGFLYLWEPGLQSAK